MSSRPVVVVTGASAGVGRATAIAFAEEGYDVALLARGRGGLDAAAADVERAGARALALEVDVADAGQVDAAVERVEGELGPIDVWVNNAMTTVFAFARDVEPGEFARATEVTYLGQVYGTMAALRRMRARGGGTIVSVGSALAYVAIPLQSAYCGAKFAVRGFHESLIAELRHEGSPVRVVQVHLPAVNTPQFDWCRAKLGGYPRPVAPVYRPEQAARAIVTSARTGRPSKVLGVWNTMLIGAHRLAPSVVAHFASRSSVGGQQTEPELEHERPGNLFQPVDAVHDLGASGRYGEEDGGMLDPAFLKQVPKTLGTLGLAIGAALTERWRRGAPARAPLTPSSSAGASG